jgi:hypothetical protein
MDHAAGVSQTSPDLRFQIADLLARAEAAEGGLDPRMAALALIETAYAASLTYCRDDAQAQHDLHTLIEAVRQSRTGQGSSASQPAPAVPPSDGASPRARLALVTAVTFLSWATVIFMSRRAPLSPWNFLGPAFCTVFALGTVYRFLVAHRWMRPWRVLSSRGVRRQ